MPAIIEFLPTDKRVELGIYHNKIGQKPTFQRMSPSNHKRFSGGDLSIVEFDSVDLDFIKHTRWIPFIAGRVIDAIVRAHYENMEALDIEGHVHGLKLLTTAWSVTEGEIPTWVRQTDNPVVTLQTPRLKASVNIAKIDKAQFRAANYVLPY